MKGESSLEMLLQQAMGLYDVRNIEPFLYDNNECVRMSAARKIQLYGGEWGFCLAKQMLHSKKPMIRGIALYILGQIKGGNPPFSRQSVPILIHFLEKDKSPYVRGEAAAALGHVSDKSSVMSLVRASMDNNDEVRASVAAALRSGFQSYPLAMDTLEKLKHDKSKKVRYWAED